MDKDKKEFIIKFGKNLQKKRRPLNVTQSQLASDMNVEISQISRVERGVQNTTIGTAYLIAQALDIHIIELFNFDEVK